jgi:hypothetical protein
VFVDPVLLPRMLQGFRYVDNPLFKMAHKKKKQPAGPARDGRTTDGSFELGGVLAALDLGVVQQAADDAAHGDSTLVDLLRQMAVTVPADIALRDLLEGLAVTTVAAPGSSCTPRADVPAPASVVTVTPVRGEAPVAVRGADSSAQGTHVL